MKDRKGLRAVVLLSGGLDSTATLYYALSKGYRCYCLIFDYGQRHRREIASAKVIAKKAGCARRVIRFRLPWKGSSLLDMKLKIGASPPRHVRQKAGRGVKEIPSTYVPARNIIFLSFALSYAEAIGARAIFIGANAIDYSGYPDCRPEFFKAFRRVARTGTKTGTSPPRHVRQKAGRGGKGSSYAKASADRQGSSIKINAPLISKSKKEIVKLAQRLEVPLEHTWSCYKGGKAPCGVCDSCTLRAKGFREAGVEDPLDERGADH